MKHILITGGAGKIANSLISLPYRLTFTDIFAPESPLENGNPRFYKGDLLEKSFCEKVSQDVDVLVHLAGSSDPNSSWESILQNNIIALQNLFSACLNNGVKKIIFASSSRVVEGYELENAEEFHAPSVTRDKITESHSVRPVSFYAVSKVFGEGLGRYYSEVHGLSFISLRIGSTLTERYDHPYGYAEMLLNAGKAQVGDLAYQTQVNRLKSTWLSRADFRQIIHKCIDYHCQFEVFNAVSGNTRAWLSIEKAKKELQYSPLDNAENWKMPPL